MEKTKSLKFKDLQNYALEPVSYYMKTFDDSFEGMGMHQHQYFEIMYAHSGGFTLEIFKEEESPQLKRIPIRPGQFIVLDGFTFHRIVIEPHTCAVIYNIEFDPKEQDEYNPFNVNSVLKVNFAAMFTETNFKRIALGEEGYAVVNDSHQVDSTFKELVLMLTGGVTSLEQACAVTIAELNLFTEISKCLETSVLFPTFERQILTYRKISAAKSPSIRLRNGWASTRPTCRGSIKNIRGRPFWRASIPCGYRKRPTY